MSKSVTAIKDIRIAAFDYPLPDSRIASHPLPGRDGCRLLVSLPDGRIEDRLFSNLPSLLGREGTVVFNNTKVIHARIPFTRPTGAAIEVFLLEPLVPEDYVLVFQTTSCCEWSCMVGNLKKWKDEYLSRNLTLPDGSEVTLKAYLKGPSGGNSRRIRFVWDKPSVNFASVVEMAGNIPIPPYLKRDSEQSDETDYQTVYSKVKGSVAAPTAGLHFTPHLLEELKAGGQRLAEVTLHVGAGTFQPVKSEEIGGHPMHTERFSVDCHTLELLASGLDKRIRGENHPLTAVGTTSVRTLESLPYLGRKAASMSDAEAAAAPPLHLGQWEAYDAPVAPAEVPGYLRQLVRMARLQGSDTIEASTAIMIAPGFSWNMVDRMVTNFHQPSSTLLLLVSSFLQPGRRPDDGLATLQWERIYRHALEGDYRFLSYGDACLLYPMTPSH